MRCRKLERKLYWPGPYGKFAWCLSNVEWCRVWYTSRPTPCISLNDIGRLNFLYLKMVFILCSALWWIPNTEHKNIIQINFIWKIQNNFNEVTLCAPSCLIHFDMARARTSFRFIFSHVNSLWKTNIMIRNSVRSIVNCCSMRS